MPGPGAKNLPRLVYLLEFAFELLARVFPLLLLPVGGDSSHFYYLHRSHASVASRRATAPTPCADSCRSSWGVDSFKTCVFINAQMVSAFFLLFFFFYLLNVSWLLFYNWFLVFPLGWRLNLIFRIDAIAYRCLANHHAIRDTLYFYKIHREANLGRCHYMCLLVSPSPLFSTVANFAGGFFFSQGAGVSRSPTMTVLFWSCRYIQFFKMSNSLDLGAISNPQALHAQCTVSVLSLRTKTKLW